MGLNVVLFAERSSSYYLASMYVCDLCGDRQMTIAETAHAGLSHVVNCRRERRNRASAKQAKIGCSLIDCRRDDGHTFLKRNGNQTGNDVGSAILLI